MPPTRTGFEVSVTPVSLVMRRHTKYSSTEGSCNQWYTSTEPWSAWPNSPIPALTKASVRLRNPILKCYLWLDSWFTQVFCNIKGHSKVISYLTKRCCSQLKFSCSLLVSFRGDRNLKAWRKPRSFGNVLTDFPCVTHKSSTVYCHLTSTGMVKSTNLMDTWTKCHRAP